MKIYFISDCDPESPTGGGIIRRGQISFLRRNGYDVVVVKPGEVSTYDKDTNTIKISGLIINSKFFYGLEALGIVSDKYIKWAKKAVAYLSNIVTSDDIIFATSGGTLAPIIVGSMLKKNIDCKFVINYHDPTDFTTLHGIYSRTPRLPHVNRNRFEKKLINTADYIITSSESYRQVLLEKYPQLSNISSCVYFGYIDKYTGKLDKLDRKKDVVNVVYGGNFGPTQSPEILGLAAKGLPNIKVTYIGRYQSNQAVIALGQETNVELLSVMSVQDYLDYIARKADVGFFSLRNNLTNYCVPSKLFDYINVGLPMLGLVRGDAKAIIENNGYGCISEDNVVSLRSKLLMISEGEYLNNCRNNVLNNRFEWSMENKIKDVVNIIESLRV